MFALSSLKRYFLFFQAFSRVASAAGSSCSSETESRDFFPMKGRSYSQISYAF